MKVNTALDVESSFQETQTFKIDASAKAFQILSGNIYKDPLRAIVRELSANAWDAHVSKGNTDVPFEISLPSSLAPELIVKDYGIGLSPEAISTLYTVYFGSDKTWTNELIGGFGLGSKTPFSYTDSFTVESRWDGKAYRFACFHDAKGLPCVSHVGTKDTDTPDDTGLTITIPCNARSDVEDRLDAVMWFPTKPIINGGELPKKKIIFQNTDFILAEAADGAYYHRNQKVFVLMGNILYHVGEVNRRNFNFDYYFKVPIGKYEPAASRETLTNVAISAFTQMMDDADKLYVKTIGVLLDDDKLTVPETMLLAYDNWQVLKSHTKVKAALEKITALDDDNEFKLRSYHCYRTNMTTSFCNLDSNSFVQDTYKQADTKIIFMPQGKGAPRHTKMIEEHFSSNLKHVYTLQCEEADIPGLKKQLKTVFPADRFKMWTEYPVTPPPPKAKKKKDPQTQQLVDDEDYAEMSASYQDIKFANDDIHYKRALQLDVDRVVLHSYDRAGLYSYHMTAAEAVNKILGLDGVLYVPCTELLTKRFRDRGFKFGYELIEQYKSGTHETHFDYRVTHSNAHDQFSATLNMLERGASKRPLFVEAVKLMEQMELRHEYSCYAMNNGDDSEERKARKGKIDVPFTRRVMSILARIHNHYPQLGDYPNKAYLDYSERQRRRKHGIKCPSKNITISDYMRYEDERRTHCK